MEKILKTDLGTIQKVNLEKMNFLYMEVKNDVESQKKAWPKFESKFPSLVGRKMYGLDYDQTKTYRLCSLVLETDNGETFGYEQFEFSGGYYLRLRLKYPPSELFKKIGPAYDFLIGNYQDIINWELPTIEYYKSKDTLDIMIPIG